MKSIHTIKPVILFIKPTCRKSKTFLNLITYNNKYNFIFHKMFYIQTFVVYCRYNFSNLLSSSLFSLLYSIGIELPEAKTLRLNWFLSRGAKLMQWNKKVGLYIDLCFHFTLQGWLIKRHTKQYLLIIIRCNVGYTLLKIRWSNTNASSEFS